jgi:hypothetical protein
MCKHLIKRDHNDPFCLEITHSKFHGFGDFGLKWSKKDNPPFTTQSLFSIILKKELWKTKKKYSSWTYLISVMGM